MIHLTDKHIAVEIPEDATELEISYENPTHLVYKFGADKIHDGFVKAEIVGVTPLTEEQWDTIVYKFGECGYMNYLVKPQYCGYLIKNSIESGISLLKSKGLDPNKKYAIIKIEKE